MTLKEEIRQAAHKYATDSWDIYERPNEFDNAYEDFLVGGDFVLKAVSNIIEKYKKESEYNHLVFIAEVCQNIINKINDIEDED